MVLRQAVFGLDYSRVDLGFSTLPHASPFHWISDRLFQLLQARHRDGDNRLVLARRARAWLTIRRILNLDGQVVDVQSNNMRFRFNHGAVHPFLETLRTESSCCLRERIFQQWSMPMNLSVQKNVERHLDVAACKSVSKTWRDRGG